MPTYPPPWEPGEGITSPNVPPPHYGPQPSYGVRPAYGAATTPPQTKRPPKTLWYVIGTALIVLGLVGVGGGVSSIVSFMGNQPSAEHTFGSGQSTTVPMDAGSRRVIFLSTDADKHNIHCDVSSPNVSSGVEIKKYDGTLTLNQWQAIFTVDVQQSRDYTVTCTGQPGDTFGVGGNASAGGLVVGILCIIGGSGLGLLGGVVLIVALVLRHRRRAA